MSKLKNYNMTRDEFKNAFMSPLEEEFGYPSYWNGKHLIYKGLKPIDGSDVLGVCHTALADKPIVIKYRKNRVIDMLSTLIHEYGHAYLHCYENDKEKISYCLEEFEAETVTFDVLKHFKVDIDKTKDIMHYYNRTTEKELNNYKSLNRDDILKDFTNRVIKAISHHEELLKSITVDNNMLYKYRVDCPLCNTSWYYTKMAKIIKKNAKGFVCTECGDKSSGKLIVHTL